MRQYIKKSILVVSILRFVWVSVLCQWILWPCCWFPDFITYLHNSSSNNPMLHVYTVYQFSYITKSHEQFLILCLNSSNTVMMFQKVITLNGYFILTPSTRPYWLLSSTPNSIDYCKGIVTVVTLISGVYMVLYVRFWYLCHNTRKCSLNTNVVQYWPVNIGGLGWSLYLSIISSLFIVSLTLIPKKHFPFSVLFFCTTGTKLKHTFFSFWPSYQTQCLVLNSLMTTHCP